MMMELVVFFIAQSVVILGAIVAAYVKIQIALAQLQMDVKHIHNTTDQLKADHEKLGDKVDGISRHVERLDAVSE